MDFDLAVDRLERDHSHIRRTQKHKSDQSRRARQQADRRKREYAKLQAAKALKERKLRHVRDVVDGCERELGVASISPSSPTPSLKPTSIHGDGDKIALPPSVLESLMSLRDAAEGVGGVRGGGGGAGGRQQQPWTFRVGMPNPDYDPKRDFPASGKLGTLMERYSGEDDDDGADADAEDDDGEEDNDDGEEELHSAYLEELAHRYLSYTHCTVVEFTQEEGNVGLPRGIASALLGGRGPVQSNLATTTTEDEEKAGGGGGGDGDGGYVVPHTRTVDPASASASAGKSSSEADGEEADEPMDVDESGGGADAPVPSHPSSDDSEGEKRTPGHPAYGLFDVPAGGVELTLVQLPRGTGCTLVPSVESLRRGFSDLKDVKAVLEQSLIRTRATLSVNDIVHTWHRGTKFDLRVSSVTPGRFGAISCINTDIEVDIGPADGAEAGRNSSSRPPSGAAEEVIASAKPAAATATEAGGGYTLKELASASASSSSSAPPTAAAPAQEGVEASLPPEPPADRTEGVCTILIRGDRAAGKRRFDVNVARVSDLYNFAGHVLRSASNAADGDGADDGNGTGTGAGAFRLVTRYPRKVYAASDNTLSDEGIPGGQHVFLVERF